MDRFVSWAIGWCSGFILALSLTLLFSPKCQAQELYAIATVKSYHQDRQHHYYEKNLGVGLQLQLNEDVAFAAGEYKNSFTHKSEYYGVLYTPFHRSNWSMGGLFVEVNGYEFNSLKKFLPVAVPLVVYQKDKLIINIPFVPPFRKQGIVAVQMGWKF